MGHHGRKILRTQTLTAYETHRSIFYTFHPARSRTGADRRTRPHDQGVGCHAHRNARGRALTGLKVARGVAATIVESDSEKLVVEADEKIIGYVVTTIDKQGVLLLTIDPEIDNIRDCDVRISIPKPEVLQSLTATSGGRVTCRTVVNTPTLNVRTTSGAHAEIACEGDGCTLSATSGSEIKANLAVGRCAIEAHSGAEINVKGVAEECKINAMSGATCKARNLLTRRTEARASSGASVRITCSETLEAAASSGGSVSYWGDCRLVGFKKNLTGSVTHKR